MGQTDHFPEWTIYSDVCWLVGLVGLFSCFGVFFFCTKLQCLAAVMEDRWESLAVCPGVECPADFLICLFSSC